MNHDNDILLAIAAVLGVAAYILTTEDVDASETPQATSGDTGLNGWANNNPGNLVYISGDPFRGQVGKAGNFGVYDTLGDGVRAMGLTLTQYYNAGLTTVTAIVSKWSTTDQAAYIRNVSDWMQVDPNEPLSWPADEVPLIQAMVRQEQGSSQMSDSDVATYIAS
jgi:hypothetical protein